jgi:hypothetical protein
MKKGRKNRRVMVDGGEAAKEGFGHQSSTGRRGSDGREKVGAKWLRRQVEVQGGRAGSGRDSGGRSGEKGEDEGRTAIG